MDPRTGRPFRVLVGGPDCLGAQCALLWFVHNAFILDFSPPRDFEAYACTVDGAAVELVAGPDVLHDDAAPRALVRDYAAHAAAAVGLLALYDVGAPQSAAALRTAVARTQELRARAGLAPLPLAVVGTRMDAADAAATAAPAAARALAAEHGASYAEVDAHTGENVRAAFTDAILAFVTAAAPHLNDNDSSSSSSVPARRRPPSRGVHTGCSLQ